MGEKARDVRGVEKEKKEKEAVKLFFLLL